MFFSESIQPKKHNSDTYLQEKYFGKDKDTKALEDEFLNLINKKGKYNCAKIEKILEKKFGFNKVIILIDEKDTSLNVCTFCNTDDIQKINIVNGEYRLKPGNNYTAFFNYSITSLSGIFSPSELTAITLHEVGHHFAAKAKLLNLNTKKLQTFISGMEELEKGWKIVPNSNSTFKLLATTSIGITTIMCFYTILKYIVLLFDSAISIGSVVKLINDKEGREKIFKRLNSNASILFNNTLTNYQSLDSEEEMADSFATILGYGPELTSVIGKIDADTESKSWSLKLLNNWYGLPCYFLFGWADPKSYGVQANNRVTMMIRTLSRELKDNSNNNANVKQISKDLEDIEDRFTKYLEYRNSKNAEDRTLMPLWDIFETNIFLKFIKGSRNGSSPAYECLRNVLKSDL